MIVILLLVIFIQHLIILYYRSEAINYRNAFELSKQPEITISPSKSDLIIGASVSEYTVKLNKDGSIAKKRGRKPKQ